MNTGSSRPADDLSRAAWGAFAPAFAYLIDSAQRATLFLDVMGQRASQRREHNAKPVPHVLSYESEVVLDGRTFERPVNYALVRIAPPGGITIDPGRRPFVIVDPRAGHGPGIGGFKADSEVGVAMKAGHPCYFVGFLPALSRVRRSQTSPARRRSSWRRLSSFTPTPTASPA